MIAMALHQSYMTQCHSLFTLISHCAIAFLFILMSTAIGFLSARWLFELFYLLAELYETI